MDIVGRLAHLVAGELREGVGLRGAPVADLRAAEARARADAQDVVRERAAGRAALGALDLEVG